VSWLIDTNVVAEWVKPRPDERVVRWLAAIAAECATIVCVTHKGVLRAVLAAATGWDMTVKAPVRLKGGALHRFEVDPEGRIEILECNISLAAMPGRVAS